MGDAREDADARALRAWMLERGARFFDAPATAVRGDARVGRRVEALEGGRAGRTLCVVPWACCLTTTTSALREACGGDEACEEEFDALEEVGLVGALAHERRLGERSAFALYVRLLPPSETLPGCGGMDGVESEALIGTSVRYVLEEDRRLMKEDHALLVEWYSRLEGAEPPTFEEFVQAASLVASRAFFIGHEIGQGMVPFADLFNHRGFGQSHIGVRGCRLADAEQDVVDVDADGSDEDKDEEQDAVRIFLCRDIESGEEVFNTFGDYHDNAALYVKYGFVERDGSVAFCYFPRAFWTPLLKKTEHQNMRLLAQLVDFCDETYEGLEYTIDADGMVSLGLLAILRTATMLLSDDEGLSYNLCKDREPMWEDDVAEQIEDSIEATMQGTDESDEYLQGVDWQLFVDLIKLRFLMFFSEERLESMGHLRQDDGSGIIRACAVEIQRTTGLLDDLVATYADESVPGKGLTGTAAELLIRSHELGIFITALLRGADVRGGDDEDDEEKEGQRKRAKVMNITPRYGPTVYGPA